MNMNLYRFSVEWCRLEPEKGVYDKAALEHYVRMMEELREAGIKICLTLHHFSHPVWFYKQGHFSTMENLKDWEMYLEYAVPKLAPYVDYWIIFNELNLPFVYTVDQRLNLLRYHALGYRIVKKYSDKPAGSAHSYSPKVPFRGQHDKLDCLMAAYADFTDNEFFFHAIRTGEIVAPHHDGRYDANLKDSCDYWPLNIYVRHMIDGRKVDYLREHYRASRFQPLRDPKAMTHLDEICPEIMIDMLMRTKDKPCLITENGISTDNDRFRIVYLTAILQALHQAMELGANVWGYSHWSLLDNWEWGTYSLPFGLAAVDWDTFTRTLRSSGHYYGEIARTGGCNQDILRRYLNTLPSIRDGEEQPAK